MRFARLPRVAITTFVFAVLSTTLSAQQGGGPVDEVNQSTSLQSAPVGRDPRASTTDAARDRRPAPLVPLYASFVTLQILDLHSTHDALARGGAEANPALAGLAGNTVAMSAVKAAGTAGVILITEKLRARNKAAALGLMIATNSAMAWVVQHNYRTGR